MAFKGIFWIKPNGELFVLKVKCDSFGNFLEDIPHDMLSKSGGNFNHKNAWNALPKSITDNKEYNYFPRGRAEIRNGKAIIFTNYITEDLKLKIIDAFYLSDGNGIEQVIFKIDNSAHYKYTAKRHGLF